MQLTVRGTLGDYRYCAAHLDGWANDADFIGIELPGRHCVETGEYPTGARIGLGATAGSVLSFWTFDTYRPYSINFGWGPQIAATTPERLTMFDSLPPHALSATYLLYGVMIAAFLIVLLVAYTIVSVQTRRRFLVTGLLSVLAVSWIVMDARMGSEFLSWMWKDYHQYIAAPVETRTFRDRGRFYDFAEFVTPLVADRQHYVFLPRCHGRIWAISATSPIQLCHRTSWMQTTHGLSIIVTIYDKMPPENWNRVVRWFLGRAPFLAVSTAALLSSVCLPPPLQ